MAGWSHVFYRCAWLEGTTLSHLAILSPCAAGLSSENGLFQCLSLCRLCRGRKIFLHQQKGLVPFAGCHSNRCSDCRTWDGTIVISIVYFGGIIMMVSYIVMNLFLAGE